MKLIQSLCSRARRRLRSFVAAQAGAFDLPSILVGVGVVGILTAGVLAGVFGVIPFTQDSASKQDLSSVTTAQGVAKAKESRYMDTAALDGAGYADPRPGWATATDAGGSCYVAVSQSAAGNTFVATNETASPAELSSATDTSCLTYDAFSGLVKSVGGSSYDTRAATMTSVWDTRLTPTWDTSLTPTGGPLTCTQITIPLTGKVDAVVNWGDGTPAETVTGILPTHTYTDTPGIKKITISGTFAGWVGENWDWDNWSYWSVDCLTQVTQWGETGTTDVATGFEMATNLTAVDRIPATATNWTELFSWATSFNGNISGWDTSKVTSMSYLFAGDPSFNQDLSSWDTSNVTSMYAMFLNATVFNANISSWNTSRVTTMAYSFDCATSFNQPLNGWNTSNVTEIEGMFTGASAFNQPLNRWDTSQVTDMSSTFERAASFTGDISTWDTTGVQNMTEMFAYTDFNGDLSGWNTSSLTTTSMMFVQDGTFNGDLSRWNTAGVTRMDYMFARAASFNRDIHGWNTAKVVTMQSMFEGASSFNQNIHSWNVAMIEVGGHDLFSQDSALQASYLPAFP